MGHGYRPKGDAVADTLHGHALIFLEVSGRSQAGREEVAVDFILAVAKVDAQYRLLDLSVLDAPQFRPHVITRHFWTGWTRYERPTLVSFNGRGYDMPLMRSIVHDAERGNYRFSSLVLGVVRSEPFQMSMKPAQTETRASLAEPRREEPPR